MTRRIVRRKRRRSPLPVLISILIVVIAVAGAAWFFQKHKAVSDEMDRMTYYGLASDQEAAIVVNDALLEKKGIVREGSVYIDYETVFRSLNSGFYWENATRSLLLTLPDGTKTWTEGDGTGCLLMEGGMPYISAECVRDNSDIALEILDDPGRVVARTRWENVSAMTLTDDGEVRYRGGPKSEILTHVKKGDTVVLLERLNDWYKVSTADGFQGYIEKDVLAEAPEGAISHESDARFEFGHIFADGKICLAWEYMSTMDNNEELEELTSAATPLNTVSPTWFSFADAEGNLNSLADASYVERAHAAGLAVWGCLQDVSGQDDLGELLDTHEERTHIVGQLLQAASDTGMDGINVDLETLQEEDAPHYLQFIKELCVAAHAQGLIVSVDNYVPLYTRYYNHAEQARTVDYIIIMGYDEHTANSEVAGSVASLPFEEQGIQDMLEMVPAEQIISGIPFYTRGWIEDSVDGSLTCKTLGMAAAKEFVEENNIELVWDSELGQYTGTAYPTDVTYSIWMEDLQSIEEKLKLIDRYGLAGVAAWRLGFEEKKVWPLIAQYVGG